MDPVSSENKPPCGGSPAALDDDLKTLLGPLLAVAGGAASLAGLAKKFPELLEWLASAVGLTSSVAVALVAAYIALQIAIITVFGVNWYRKCRQPKGVPSCLTGIVDAVHDATLPPLTIRARHPHVDLVVKPAYWSQFGLPGVQYVYCTDTGLGGLRSPLVKVFFKSGRVCTVLAAAFGGSLTAPLVALAAFNGIIATAGAATLGGMLAFFGLALLFWLAALIAGAVAGAIAKAATEPDAPQASPLSPDGPGSQGLPPGYGQTTTIGVGDLLTVQGPSVVEGNHNRSLAVRFAGTTYALGSYAAVASRPYTHADALEAIPDEVDLCQPRPTPRPEEPEPPEPPPPSSIPPNPTPVP